MWGQKAREEEVELRRRHGALVPIACASAQLAKTSLSLRQRGRSPSGISRTLRRSRMQIKYMLLLKLKMVTSQPPR